MIKTLIKFAVIAFLWWGSGTLVFAMDVSPDSSFFSKVNKIRSGKNGVQIKVENLQLDLVLRRINKLVGVEFSFPDSLGKEVVYANIRASNWQEALGLLLQDYSRFEFWAGDLQKSRIRLFVTGEDSARTILLPHQAKVVTAKKMAGKKHQAWNCFSLTGPKEC